MEEGNDALQDEISKTEELFNTTQKELIRIRNVGQEINENGGKIANLLSRVQTLQEKLGKTNDTTDAEKNLSELYTKLNTFSKEEAFKKNKVISKKSLKNKK